MTIQENILTLNEHLEHWKRLLSEKICDQDEGEKTIDALQNAIKALEQEPSYNSIKAELSCDADCIRRSDMLDAVGHGTTYTSEEVQDIIDSMPPVTPQPCDDVPETNDGNIYECHCGYGWDKSKVIRHHFCPNCGRAVDNLIKTELNRVKTELEPCEDAVSRQDLREPRFIIAENDYQKGWNDALDSVYENAPSVQPQPKMGHWIHDGSHWENRWICSECGYKLIDVQTNYCPNCGAKMQEVEG